jgi:hypothetical protein
MKFLKIILIIVLFVACSISSLGIGTITSGDKTIDLADSYGETGDDVTLENRDTYYRLWSDDRHTEYEEYVTLIGWFKSLSLEEKVELYNHWQKKDDNYVLYQKKDSGFLYWDAESNDIIEQIDN